MTRRETQKWKNKSLYLGLVNRNEIQCFTKEGFP